METIETLIVVAIVTLAALLLLRGAIKKRRGPDAGKCGGCPQAGSCSEVEREGRPDSPFSGMIRKGGNAPWIDRT